VDASKTRKEIIEELTQEGKIISERYNFFSLDKIQITNIINSIINLVINESKTEDIKSLFIVRLETSINNIIKYILKSKSAAKYLKESLTLNEISDIYNTYNIELSIETAAELLKNSNLLEEIKEYVSKIPIENVKDDQIITFINAYSIALEREQNNLIETREETNNYDGLKILLNTSIKDELLSKDEEIELLNRMKNGDIKAREKLILANTKLVVSIAKKYKTIPLEDAIQEGIGGLIIAIDRFDIKKGVRLSTYATPWITAKIQRSIINNQLIKPSVNTYQEILNIKKIQNEYLTKTGKALTTAKLSELTNIPTSLINDALEANNIISLNTKINDEDNTELLNFIPDNNTNFTEEIENEDYVLYILRELKKNNINEFTIKMLEMRIGINGIEPKTYYEIANIFHTTEQNVRARIQRLAPKITEICDENYHGILKENINKNIFVFKSKIKEILPHVIGILPKSDIELLKKLNTNRIEDMKKNEITYIISILIPRIKVLLNEKTIKEEQTNKTIFEIIGKYGCSEEIIMEAYNYLPPKMQEIIKRRNGDSLKETTPKKEYTKRDDNYFKHRIIKCLKSICRSLVNSQPIDENLLKIKESQIRKRQTIKEKLEPISIEEYEHLLSELNDKDKELIYLNDTKTIRLTKKNRSDINSGLMPKLRRKIKRNKDQS